MNDEQIAALREAQSLLGARWKSKIRDAWKTGKYPAAVRHISALLQQVRNLDSGALDKFARGM